MNKPNGSDAGKRSDPPPCSVFQIMCIDAISRHGLNGSMSLVEMADRLRSSRIACSSAMRSLERKGMAVYFRSHPGDKWSVQMWSVSSPNATDHRREMKG
jgi:hypothetical protein